MKFRYLKLDRVEENEMIMSIMRSDFWFVCKAAVRKHEAKHRQVDGEKEKKKVA